MKKKINQELFYNDVDKAFMLTSLLNRNGEKRDEDENKFGTFYHDVDKATPL